ncbi:helix-hairpin-helix domain-containing protein [Clostridium sp. AM58-1XD]|uniref:helix-hairpin-helix domain-containing protein n=1 Tax=Clostridium sp. AM58-1XD TaxID=2292307 RepID=UPI000E4DABFE|nr:helix-hairpin-helix domain-containing protein [Clostridium sp. AM58-1XD]RGY99088.1 hypothetical protein DXA13_09205 [Clostridium sp. AM58-1XD]
MKGKYGKLIFAVICMACAGIFYNMDKNEALSQVVSYEEAPQDDLSEGAFDSSGSGEPETEPSLCYVHICGEVAVPGVYQVEEGSRIFQALEAAGGLTDEAAAEYLNLAGCVQDGMKIVVPSYEEAEKSGLTPEGGNPSDGTVNLNTATREQLMTLSGIGEARAEDIIRFREENGPFRTIEDIKKVPGIKEAAFQKMKDKISV